PSGQMCTRLALAADGLRLAFVLISNNVASIVVQDRGSSEPYWVSLTTNGVPAVVNDTATPVISPDGKLVVFESVDSRLVADDWNRAIDIFASDLVTGQTRLVSRRHPDHPALTSYAASRWLPGCFDAGGTRAACFTFEDDSAAPYTNQFGHVLVRDLASSQLRLVGSLTNLSLDPALSADGRYLAYFASVNPSASLGVLGTVYWADQATGSNLLVATGVPRDYSISSSSHLALSSDGSQVAFE